MKLNRLIVALFVLAFNVSQVQAQATFEDCMRNASTSEARFACDQQFGPKNLPIGAVCGFSNHCSSNYCLDNKCQVDPLSVASPTLKSCIQKDGIAFCCESGSFACESACNSYFASNPSVPRACPAAGGGVTQAQSPGSSASAGCGPGFTEVAGTCIPSSNQTGGFFGQRTFGEMVSYIIKALLMLAGVLAVFFIILGGYRYITAQGNDDQAEEGKKTLRNAIIGLVLVMVSFVIVTIVTNTLSRGL